MNPTVNIQFDCVPGPYGGGNQFIKALKNQWIARGVYAEDVARADVVLFNSDHSLASVLAARRRFRDKIFVHRLAGPMYIPRGSGMEADRLVYQVNEAVADGTIFQSEWSRRENHRAGLPVNRHETLIINAPDPALFHRSARAPAPPDGKIRLIASSWSANLGKGFPIYKYIDEHLDFNRFSFTFVGRSPCAFRNIVHVPPQTTPELAKLLAAHDVFLSASRYEACSNSVLEAMHCGLPAVVFNDSSNPEIIGAGGRAFDSENDVIAAIEEVAAHLEEYRRKVDLPGIDEVGDRYWKFCRQIWTESRQGAYAPKRLGRARYFWLVAKLPDFAPKRGAAYLRALGVGAVNVGRRSWRKAFGGRGEAPRNSNREVIQ